MSLEKRSVFVVSDRTGCVTVTSVTWARQSLRHCASVDISTHSTRGEAESACLADSSCWGIYDNECDGSEDWQTCPSGGHQDSSVSCLYEKQLP